MSKKFTDADFNDGITPREAYIHTLYHTTIASLMLTNGKKFADDTAAQVREFADVLYPQPKRKGKAHG